MILDEQEQPVVNVKEAIRKAADEIWEKLDFRVAELDELPMSDNRISSLPTEIGNLSNQVFNIFLFGNHDIMLPFCSGAWFGWTRTAKIKVVFHSNSVVNTQIKFQVLQLVLTAIVLLLVSLLTPASFARFFSLGDVNAHISQSAWLGLFTLLEIALVYTLQGRRGAAVGSDLIR